MGQCCLNPISQRRHVKWGQICWVSAWTIARPQGCTQPCCRVECRVWGGSSMGCYGIEVSGSPEVHSSKYAGECWGREEENEEMQHANMGAVSGKHTRGWEGLREGTSIINRITRSNQRWLKWKECRLSLKSLLIRDPCTVLVIAHHCRRQAALRIFILEFTEG